MTHKAAAHSTTPSRADNDQPSLGTLAIDLLDTAWRIAVPITACAGLGIVIDNTLHSGPWCTLLGVLVGFAISGLLVKLQLQAVERAENARKDTTEE